jgi:hypothetical protein
MKELSEFDLFREELMNLKRKVINDYCPLKEDQD